MKITIELYPEMLTADDRRLLRMLAGEEAAAAGGVVETAFELPDDEPIRAGGTSSDDADERVVRDWTPAARRPGMTVTFDEPPAKGTTVTVTVTPPAEIPRSEVVLKVGDKVKLRDGDTGTVTGCSDLNRETYPFVIDDGGTYTPTGRYYLDEISSEDVVEINGVRIIDQEPQS
jgi:hypothetical protein